MLCLHQCSLPITTPENKKVEQDTHTQCKFSQRCTVMRGFNMLGKFKRLLYEIYLVISNNVLTQCCLNCVEYFGAQLCEVLGKIKKKFSDSTGCINYQWSPF